MIMVEEPKRKGGRPKGEEMVKLNSQIPERHDQMLRDYCQKHEVTITVALKRAIEKLMEAGQ